MGKGKGAPEQWVCVVRPGRVMFEMNGVTEKAAREAMKQVVADSLNERFTAFTEIGGPNPGQFDWGLPFFYGRTIFVGIEGQRAGGVTGPFWAY